jgi:hypothetical protein
MILTTKITFDPSIAQKWVQANTVTASKLIVLICMYYHCVRLRWRKQFETDIIIIIVYVIITALLQCWIVSEVIQCIRLQCLFYFKFSRVISGFAGALFNSRVPFKNLAFWILNVSTLCSCSFKSCLRSTYKLAVNVVQIVKRQKSNISPNIFTWFSIISRVWFVEQRLSKYF